MKLNFLGLGSAFNPSLDNTSAFFIENNNFYLLDCGESVFKKIKELKELNESKNIFIMITHLHCDHVGSLGSLISYLYLKLNKKAYIIHPTEKIIDYLDIVGIERDFYIYEKTLPEISSVKNYEIEVSHVSNMQCFGYKIMLQDKSIYYSGDAIEIPEHILNEFLLGKISEIYQDTCSYIAPVPTHGNIYYLEEKIPFEKRKNVYGIHLDKDFREEMKKKNFGVINDIVE